MLNRLLKGVGANALMQLVVVFLQLALVPIFATQWGLERYGIWLLLFTIPAYLAQGDFGFGTAAGNDMIMKVARGDRQGALVTYQSARAAILCASLAIAVLSATAMMVAPAAWFGGGGIVPPGEIRLTLLLMILYGIACLQGGLVQAGFRCVGKYSIGVMLSAATALGEGVLAAAIVLLGGTLWEVALCYLVARVVFLALQALIMFRQVPFLNLGFANVSMDEIRRLWPLAAGVMVLPLTLAIFLQGTVLVVGLAASPAMVAVFTPVRTLVRSGVQMTTLLNHALMPEMARAAAQGERSVPVMVLLTVAGSLLVVVPGAIVLLIAGQDIVRIWTHGMIYPPYPFLASMVGVMVVNGIWHPLSNLLLATNRQRSYSYVYLVAALACVGASYVLTCWLGILGAGLASLTLDLFMAQFVIRKVRLYLVPNLDFSEVRSILATIADRIRRRRT